VVLHLLDTITLLHPYNGHILGIFLNVHVILLGQRECATAQTGPYFQTVLFGHLGEGHGTHLTTPHPDGCVARSLRIFVLPLEDQRRWMSSTFAPGVGFNTYTVWSSRTFGVRSEGGVPNSNPSEPRPDLREGRGFDPVGAVSAPKRHPSGWAPRWCPAKHSPCYPAKNVILSPREQRFQN